VFAGAPIPVDHATTFPSPTTCNYLRSDLRTAIAENKICAMIRELLSCIKRRPLLEHLAGSSTAQRGIAATSSSWVKKMPDRPPPVNEDDFTEAFLKGSGPGGQKIVGLYQMDLMLVIMLDHKLITEPTEQNLICCTIKTHSHRLGPQSSSYTLSHTESENCETDAGRKG
jgi:hypothetical protein